MLGIAVDSNCLVFRRIEQQEHSVQTGSGAHIGHRGLFPLG
jgi:hypothetical protein